MKRAAPLPLTEKNPIRVNKPETRVFYFRVKGIGSYSRDDQYVHYRWVARQNYPVTIIERLLSQNHTDADSDASHLTNQIIVSLMAIDLFPPETTVSKENALSILRNALIIGIGHNMTLTNRENSLELMNQISNQSDTEFSHLIGYSEIITNGDGEPDYEEIARHLFKSYTVTHETEHCIRRSCLLNQYRTFINKAEKKRDNLQSDKGYTTSNGISSNSSGTDSDSDSRFDSESSQDFRWNPKSLYIVAEVLEKTATAFRESAKKL